MPPKRSAAEFLDYANQQGVHVALASHFPDDVVLTAATDVITFLNSPRWSEEGMDAGMKRSLLDLYETFMKSQPKKRLVIGIAVAKDCSIVQTLTTNKTEFIKAVAGYVAELNLPNGNREHHPVRKQVEVDADGDVVEQKVRRMILEKTGAGGKVYRVFDQSPQTTPVETREHFADVNYGYYCRGFDLMGEYAYKPLGEYVQNVWFAFADSGTEDHVLVEQTEVAVNEFKVAEINKFERFVAFYPRTSDGKPRDISVPWLKKSAIADGLRQVKTAFNNDEVVECMRSLFEKMAIPQASLPRGICAWGPPGTGKTEICKSTGASIGMVPVRPAGFAAGEMLDGLQGGTEKNVKTVFRRALCCPWLLFALIIDEIESLVPNRNKKDAGSKGGASSSVLGVILTYFQGMSDVPNVFVFGATNLKLDIDPAFDRRMHGKIFVGPPTVTIRRDWRMPSSVALTDDGRSAMAKLTVGMSGANMNLVTQELVVHAYNHPDNSISEKHLFDAVQLFSRRNRIFCGANTICEIFNRSGHTLGNGSARAKLMWSWYFSEHKALLDVIGKFLTDPTKQMTGRLVVDLSALHETPNIADKDEAARFWLARAPSIDLEFRDGSVHTVRPQAYGQRMKENYIVGFEHYVALMVELAVQLDVNVLRVFDKGYFSNEGCDSEDDMVHRLNEEIAQASECPRSIVLLDLDSCCVDVNLDADQVHESIHHATLFHTMVQVARSFSFVESKDRFMFVVCLSTFRCVLSRVDYTLKWPQSVGRQVTDLYAAWCQKPQECNRCTMQFRAGQNDEFACKPHVDEAKLYSTKEASADSTVPSTRPLALLDSLSGADRSTMVWDCCGQPWSTPQCSNLNQGKLHEPKAAFTWEGEFRKLGRPGAHAKAKACWNAVNAALKPHGAALCWCNWCSSPCRAEDTGNAAC